MSSVTDTALRNTQSLRASLDGIFLAIGNAYYEANMALRSPQATSSVTRIFPDSDAQIMRNKALFLDSLDQLEILALRATEVLERQARMNASRAPFMVTSNLSKKPEDLVNGKGTAAGQVPDDAPTQASSPEMTLLHGAPLEQVHGKGIQDVNTDADAANAKSDEPTDGLDLAFPTGAQQIDNDNAMIVQTNGDNHATDAHQAGMNLPADAMTLDNLSAQFGNTDDIMNLDGSIDFGMGDMMFDNFNFDDTTQFDFGSMMED